MKCNLLLLASALGAVSALPQINKTCNSNGQIALIVDGPTKEAAPKLLERLSTNGISALVTVSNGLLSGPDNLKMVNDAIKSGHEIAYRIELSGDRLAEATEANLTMEIKQAKLRIQDVYNVPIKFVMFPYTTDPKVEQMFATAAEKAGLKAVGHSIYLDPNEEKAKQLIEEHIYDAKTKSYIALIQGNKGHEETLKKYKEQATKWGFQLVSASTCLAGEPVKKSGYVATNFVGNKHHHKRRHQEKPKNKNKNKNKKNLLINPRFIQGYKGAKGKNKGGDNPVHDPLKPISATKMPAQVGNDFKANEPKLVAVDGAKAFDKKGGDNGADDKKQPGDKVDGQKKNSATRLLAGTSSLIMIATLGLVTLL